MDAADACPDKDCESPIMELMKERGLVRLPCAQLCTPSRIAKGILEHAEGVALCGADCAVLELLVWMRPWMESDIASGRCEPKPADEVRCAGTVKMELELLRAQLNLLPWLFDEPSIRRFFEAMPMPSWVAAPHHHTDAVTMVYDWIRVAVEMQARFQAYVELRDDYERAVREWPKKRAVCV